MLPSEKHTHHCCKRSTRTIASLSPLLSLYFNDGPSASATQSAPALVPMGDYWGKLGWERKRLHLGYGVHVISETSSCSVGPAAEILITLPMELSLALYPSPTWFLLRLFSSPDLGLFNLEERN